MEMYQLLELSEGSFDITWEVVPGQRYVLRWYCTGTPTAGEITVDEQGPGASYTKLVSGTDSDAAQVRWDLSAMTLFTGGCEFVAVGRAVSLSGGSIAGTGDYYAGLVEARN